MDKKALWMLRLVCAVGSFLSLCVASLVSGLYYCPADWDLDSCIMLQCKVGGCVVGSWVFCAVILRVLYLTRSWLTESAKKSDRLDKKLGGFFYRLGKEVLYIIAGIVMPVVSVKAVEKVPAKNDVMSCAFLMSSVILLSFAFLESDDFGLYDTVLSIFLSIQNLTVMGHHTEKHHIRKMFITAGVCSIGRLIVFISKEYMRWNRSADGAGGDTVQATILESLRERMEVVTDDPNSINMLNTLRDELCTLRRQAFLLGFLALQ